MVRGFAFRPIAIGALVPAAVMQHSAPANLFPRQTLEILHRYSISATPRGVVAKIARSSARSALVRAFTISCRRSMSSILLNCWRMWFCQTLPGVVLGDCSHAGSVPRVCCSVRRGNPWGSGRAWRQGLKNARDHRSRGSSYCVLRRAGSADHKRRVAGCGNGRTVGLLSPRRDVAILIRGP